MSVSEFLHQPNKQKPVWHHGAANTWVYLPKMSNQLKEVCFVIKDLILQSGFNGWHQTLSVPAGLRHEFRLSLMTSTHLRSKSFPPLPGSFFSSRFCQITASLFSKFSNISLFKCLINKSCKGLVTRPERTLPLVLRQLGCWRPKSQTCTAGRIQ